MQVTSIDIGVVCMGISCSIIELAPHFHIVHVLHAETVNLIELTRKACTSKRMCAQFNQKTHSHYVRHLLLDKRIRKTYFHPGIRRILCERQPRGGYTSIEQLLHWNFPKRFVLQSPTTLGAFLGTLNKPRVEKKRASEALAVEYLWNIKGFKQRQALQEHVHDMCDTVCYTLLWLKKKRERYASKLENNPFKSFVYLNNDVD